MSGVLQTVDQRTQLAGENRLELLLFRLNGEQVYGINVFKVKEIINSVPLTSLPNSHPVIRGVSTIRGSTVPIFDLNMGIGGDATVDPENKLVVVTEINQFLQGFIIHDVRRIENISWEEMHLPPAGLGKDCYLTAVTKIDNQIVEIIDIEKILQEVSPDFGIVTEDKKQEVVLLTSEKAKLLPDKQVKVLICDDSRVARNQLKKTLDQLGVKCVARENGQQALDLLKRWVDKGADINKEFIMLITDIEMPEMDGYKLTTEVREDPNLRDLFVVMHSSLSGQFNQALIDKVGANGFIPKFSPDKIAEAINNQLKT